MAEHRHGEMDVSAQEKTFEGFVKIAAYFILHVLAILLLLAIFRT